MSKYVDMPKEFREELTAKAIASARDKAGLCKAFTVAGSLCSRSAKDKTGYCFQHVPMMVELPVMEEDTSAKKRRTRKARKEETEDTSVKKRRTRKARKEEKEETEIELTDEEKLVFPGFRIGLTPWQKISRAKMFPRPKDQKRYFAALELQSAIGLMLMISTNYLTNPNSEHRFSGEEQDEVYTVIDELQYRADAILDEMEERGRCHSSSVKELRKSMEKRWNKVYGTIIQEMDTTGWERSMHLFDTN
jgi:hypothetical protein